jgi:predicted amidophosphoribosyltransferase
VAGRSIVSGWGGRAAESLFAALFPSDCRICGTPLVTISRLPVCDECHASIHPIAGCVCSVCGERISSPYAVSGIDGEPRCRLCRRIQPPLAKAVAYGSYEGGRRELIHLLKSGGIQRAWSVLGRMLAGAIEDLEIDVPRARVAVVSVPRDRAKPGQRGFHQAERIARAALKLQPWPGGLRLLEGVLERKRDTCPQTGLTSHQRRKNMRGAFTVARPEEVKGRPLLGVDDLYMPEFCTAPEHLKYRSPRGADAQGIGARRGNRAT